MTDKIPQGNEKTFIGKLLCAWCGQPISEDGIELYAQGGYEDSYGGATDEADATLDIVCTNENCPKYNKSIYKKESNARTW